MPTLTEAYLSIHEHDEQYPKSIKSMSISELLEQLKTKCEDDYHTVESIIERHFPEAQSENNNFESGNE